MTIKKQFDENGAVWPIQILSTDEILFYKNKLLNTVTQTDLMNSDYRCKSQVLFKWVADIATHPKMIDAVTQILGPDIHCWDNLFWIKNPESEKIVSYHQDATYWNFAPKDAVTVWLAFDDVTEDMGPIEYLLGSHLGKQLDHHDVKSEKNLLMRGQTVKNKPNDKITLATLKAGEITIHSPYIVHGSGCNKSDKPRLACGFIFAAAHVKPIVNYSPESTLWVAGQDKHNNFIHDDYPLEDMDKNLAAWQKAYDRQHDNYFKIEN